MIPANKKPWADVLLYRYFSASWKKTFQAIYLKGGEHLNQLPLSRPAIAYANHTNWWDLLMVFRLTREAPHKSSYGMMEEKQLRPYRFFSWLGAFSVDLSQPGRAAAGLRYAVKKCREPQTLLWLFPEGELKTPYEPFTIKPGLEFLARAAPEAYLVPCAFRYEFFRDDRPVALLSIGQPMEARTATPSSMTQAVQVLVEGLLVTARSRDLSEFRCLQPPVLTINKKWELCLNILRGRRAEFNPHN